MNAAFARNLTNEELKSLIVYRTAPTGLDVLIRESLSRMPDDCDDCDDCDGCEEGPTPEDVLDAVAP